MKIKRYFAPDMRQAIRMVRDEQGSEAVILSNRRVNGGIELISAVDYDESLFGSMFSNPSASERSADRKPAPEPSAAPATSSVANAGKESVSVEWSQDPHLTEMRREIKTLRGIVERQLTRLAWNDMARTEPQQAELMQRLSELGLGASLAKEIASRTEGANGMEHAWRQALAVLAHRLQVTDDDILTHGGVVSIVGPTGVGKTTMVAKLAARYALRHGKRHVALISTDNFRIGAYEQLHTYGQLLGVPVYSANDRASLERTIADLSDKRLVLIDTAGMSQRDMHLSEYLTTLESDESGIRTYLVLSANTQSSSISEVVQAFRRVKLNGCLITKLDESTRLGGVLSGVIRHELPVAYVGDGQRVPEDIHPARAHSLVTRAVALSQQSGTWGESAAQWDPNGGTAANVHA